MNKRKLGSVALCAMLFALCSSAEAQQPMKIPRIGFVGGTGSPADPGPYVEALRQGLRDLGHVEGKNIVIEYRGAEGKLDRVPALVAEFVQLSVDVLVVGNLPAIRAAKEATKTIPIVMVTSVDPVATGLVDSLARPGANMTGLATLRRDLSGKRLELLTEVVPRMSRVGVLWDANAPAPAIAFKEYEAVAHALKKPLQSLEVRGPTPDLEGAFQAATKGRANGLIVLSNPVLTRYQKQIAEFAIKHRLSSMCEQRRYVEDGCLLSYATNDADQYRRAAIYVDKILKGAKPAELPIEQPMKFEFVINQKTAKQIGLTIPPDVLARATKIIR